MLHQSVPSRQLATLSQARASIWTENVSHLVYVHNVKMEIAFWRKNTWVWEWPKHWTENHNFLSKTNPKPIFEYFPRHAHAYAQVRLRHMGLVQLQWPETVSKSDWRSYQKRSQPPIWGLWPHTHPGPETEDNQLRASVFTGHGLLVAEEPDRRDSKLVEGLHIQYVKFHFATP